MTANRTAINGYLFERAVVLIRSIAGREFCQSIILSSDLHIMELQPFLDCHEGIDFFSVRAVDHVNTDLNHLIASYGDGIRTILVEPFREVDLKVGGFHGDESSLIEVAEVCLYAVDGSCVSMSPDPDRNVADQMRLTSAP